MKRYDVLNNIQCTSVISSACSMDTMVDVENSNTMIVVLSNSRDKELVGVAHRIKLPKTSFNFPGDDGAVLVRQS